MYILSFPCALISPVAHFKTFLTSYSFFILTAMKNKYKIEMNSICLKKYDIINLTMMLVHILKATMVRTKKLRTITQINVRTFQLHPTLQYSKRGKCIAAVSVMSEYPQDGGSVCCSYDYRIDAWLQNCIVHCILRVIRYVMFDTCHADESIHKMVAAGKRLTASIFFWTSNI